LFETNKGNFSGSKPIIGKRITFNPEEIGAFGLEQFFLYTVCVISRQSINENPDFHLIIDDQLVKESNVPQIVAEKLINN
jgi:hypothetical protein